MEAMKVRVKRFNFAITNKDLSTLQEGENVNEIIPFFYIEYFREKLNYLNLKDI